MSSAPLFSSSDSFNALLHQAVSGFTLKCRETDWVITCYKWPASATLETPSGLLTGETSRVVSEVWNSWNWQLSTLWMVTLTCISSLSSSRVGGLLVKRVLRVHLEY